MEIRKIAECVVTRKSDGVYELKNIAVMPNCQRKGYGKSMIYLKREQ